ncbi:MAG: type II secretion system F family protein [Deltaproteobacteria bacterium]|nr:type II secretion system F family protein [Deltaproteobacteria bacterium]
MPAYRCKISTQGGRIIEKILMGSNKASLKEHLEREGNFVFDISRAEGLWPFLKKGKRQKRIKLKDLLVFNQEFAVLIKAGLPIVSALNLIIEKSDPREELIEVLSDVRDDVSSGASLSEAFNNFSQIFSNLYVATLQAGERSGNISLAINRYIAYMKKIGEIRQKIIAASVYPVILTMVSIFALLFLLIYVVPSFTKTFFEAGTQLPGLTLLLVNVSDVIKSNFIFFLIFVVAGYIGYHYSKQTGTGKMYLDKFKLGVPYIGGIYVHYALAKLSRTLSTVVAGGTPLVDSVRISSGTLDNAFLSLKLEEAANDLEKGTGFSESLARTGAFPRLALGMIEAGESSGALEQVLDDVADFYETDVDTRLSVLTSSIEPALMIIMGLLIGFIVLAMYMPIFQMASTVGY